MVGQYHALFKLALASIPGTEPNAYFWLAWGFPQSHSSSALLQHAGWLLAVPRLQGPTGAHTGTHIITFQPICLHHSFLAPLTITLLPKGSACLLGPCCSSSTHTRVKSKQGEEGSWPQKQEHLLLSEHLQSLQKLVELSMSF